MDGGRRRIIMPKLLLLLLSAAAVSGKKQFLLDEEDPMALLSHPVVAATYYFGRSAGTGGRRGEEEAAEAASCVGVDGRQGACHEAARCIELAGTPMGRCRPQGVCCIVELECGGTTGASVSYFRSPPGGGPPTACKARVLKTKEACRMRLDFLEFDLQRPLEGDCADAMLVVSGQSENSPVPKMCGLNAGQHYYVDVEESGGISLHVSGGGSFDIRIQQLGCDAAPPHCLQYHRGTRGSLKSFNYDEAAAGGQGYPNNMDYVICIKKEPGFCSVTYHLSSEGRAVAPFAVGALASGSGLTGPVAADCPDDFLLFAGVRVCSGRVAPNVPTANRPVREPNATFILTDATPGPFLVRFVSNGSRNARGFHITYAQNPCK